MEKQFHRIRPKKSKHFSRAEWETILKRNDLNNISKKRLKDSLLQGIPSDLRGEIWIFLTKANQLSGNFSENVYTKLLQKIDETVLLQIERDLHRTYPEQKIFQDKGGIGQQALNNILCAYANYDPEVGYCQGMGFIVGCLLIQIRHEELSFWAFVQIMNEFNWRLIFKYFLFRDGTPRLIILISAMEKDVKRRFPDLFNHFQEWDVQLLACFTQYFITLFLYDTPSNIGIRIFDIFLLEGERVLFELLYKMLAIKKKKIMELRSQQSLFEYLRKRLVRECFEEYSLATLFSSGRQEDLEMDELD